MANLWVNRLIGDDHAELLETLRIRSFEAVPADDLSPIERAFWGSLIHWPTRRPRSPDLSIRARKSAQNTA